MISRRLAVLAGLGAIPISDTPALAQTDGEEIASKVNDLERRVSAIEERLFGTESTPVAATPADSPEQFSGINSGTGGPVYLEPGLAQCEVTFSPLSGSGGGWLAIYVFGPNDFKQSANVNAPSDGTETTQSFFVRVKTASDHVFSVEPANNDFQWTLTLQNI